MVAHRDLPVSVLEDCLFPRIRFDEDGMKEEAMIATRKATIDSVQSELPHDG